MEETPPIGSFENNEQCTSMNDNESACFGPCICSKCSLEDKASPNASPCLPQDKSVAADGLADNRKESGSDIWDEPLLPSLKTTKFEAFLMVLHIVMRHGMTGPLVEDLLKFINTLLGENVIPTSIYYFNKLFSPRAHLAFHFYCPLCNEYLGERSTCVGDQVKCDECEKVYDVNLELGNFFVTIPVRQQLEELFGTDEINLMPRKNQVSNRIRDITDGKLYQWLCQKGKPLEDENSLTITFNVDGAPMWNCGRGAIWPLQYYINEIVPEERFSLKNILLAGLWFGKSAPPMSLFLTPFIKELQDLAVKGIKRVNPNGNVVECPIFAINCSVDSVAKPKLQSIKQFNGRFGCGYCLHPNTPTKYSAGKGRYSAFKTYAYRTHESMLEDMLKAHEIQEKTSTVGTNKSFELTHGLKGISPLLSVPAFQIVDGFVIDYMHAILAGVISKVTDLFFNSSSHGKEYYIKDSSLFDSRLLAITPPQSISRRPQSVEQRAHWKCKEWRSFLLYYCLPCLDGFLPKKYFNNLKLLVAGIHILLRDSILQDELSDAESLLSGFILGYNKLYGDENMTYNIHLCTHLTHMVSQWGPLWVYSAFPFESSNGHLLKLVKGTRGVTTQICHKYATVKFASHLISQHLVSERVFKFCSDTFAFAPLKLSKKFGDTTALGTEVVENSTTEEEKAFLNAMMPLNNGKISYFNRVVRNNVVYYSKAYKKPKKFNDTCVSLSSNGYGIIEKLVIHGTDTLWALVRPLRISLSGHLAPHIKTCAANMYDPLIVLPFDSIHKKCVLINLETGTYVCDIPNIYEKD